MRLSEAIMLGRVTISKPTPLDVTRCALGMAANAVNIAQNYIAIEEFWPWINDYMLVRPCAPPCSLSGTSERALLGISHLFDSHVMRVKDWTLEQLVDWVRSVEPQDEQTDVGQGPGIASLEAMDCRK